MLVRQCAQAFHKRSRSRYHTTFTLHWLNHHRYGFIANQFFNGLEVIQFCF